MKNNTLSLNYLEYINAILVKDKIKDCFQLAHTKNFVLYEKRFGKNFVLKKTLLSKASIKGRQSEPHPINASQQAYTNILLAFLLMNNDIGSYTLLFKLSHQT